MAADTGSFASRAAQAREKNTKTAQAEDRAGARSQRAGRHSHGDAIEAFHRRQDLTFGIPAHRSGTGGVESIATRWTGSQAFRADVGMNKGTDNRHQSWQVEPTAMQLFARAVGADETLFSTNGSTENVHVAMMATVRPGQELVMARNGHKSAFSGWWSPGPCRSTSNRSETNGGRSPMASTRAGSYPPGIPVIAPGELLNDAIVDYLQRLATEGVMVEGVTDESPAEFRVAAA